MDYTKILTYEKIIALKKIKSIFESMPAHCIATQSIFIHIPKAAGMAIVNSLYQKNQSNHDTWREYYKRDKGKFNKYFKFTFVREPVDRFISAYEYLSKGGKNDIDIYWQNKYIKRYSTPDEFIINGGLEKAIKKGVEHFIPQCKFVYDGNSIVVDFVGRYEDIENDFNYIAEKIGVKANLKKINGNKQKRSIELSESALLKLHKIYNKDFELFDYRTYE